MPKIKAKNIQLGDSIYLANKPYHRPTELDVGWYRVHKILDHKKDRHPISDVISFRLTKSPWSDDDIPFNVETLVECRRNPHPKARRPDGRERSSQRCPKCKKLRKRWILANAMHSGRQLWERIEEGKSKVCHICVARHRGEPIGVVHGGPPEPKKAKPPKRQPPPFL